MSLPEKEQKQDQESINTLKHIDKTLMDIGRVLDDMCRVEAIKAIIASGNSPSTNSVNFLKSIAK